jgi:hypothetical protein
VQLFPPPVFPVPCCHAYSQPGAVECCTHQVEHDACDAPIGLSIRMRWAYGIHDFGRRSTQLGAAAGGVAGDAAALLAVSPGTPGCCCCGVCRWAGCGAVWNGLLAKLPQPVASRLLACALGQAGRSAGRASVLGPQARAPAAALCAWCWKQAGSSHAEV